MTLGAQIQKLRHEKGLTAVDLAKQVEKSESTIRMWESNNSKPDVDILAKLAEIFDCSTDYILGLTANRKSDSTNKLNLIIDKFNDKLASLSDSRQGLVINSFNALLTELEAFHKSAQNDEFGEMLLDFVEKIWGVIYYTNKVIETQKQEEAVTEENQSMWLSGLRRVLLLRRLTESRLHFILEALLNHLVESSQSNERPALLADELFSSAATGMKLQDYKINKLLMELYDE